MSDIIQEFKEKYYEIKEQVDKASKSIEVDKFIKIEQEHKLAIKTIENQRDSELESIKEEYEKRLKLLSSNRDKIAEYEQYVEAAKIQYLRKEKEINSKYQDLIVAENEKFAIYKEEKNKELEDSKKNLRRKKFDELREKEINSLMGELDNLSKEYAKEKEELEIKYKEENKKIKEEFSSAGIKKIERGYHPEEMRKYVREYFNSALYLETGMIPVEFLYKAEILRDNEIGKRIVDDRKRKEEAKTESDFRKINEEKYSEINESIKQLKALKFEEVEQELIANEKNQQQINVPDDFDSQTI